VTKPTVLLIGIVVLVVNMAILGIAVSYGLRGNLSFDKVIQALSEAIDLKRHLTSVVCVLVSCGILYFSNVTKWSSQYTVLLVASLLIAGTNILSINNILSVFDLIFAATVVWYLFC
jgi:TRAP-type C4-dicarboxylate transport system permease small subunit